MAVLKLKWNVMDLQKICGYGLFSSTILAVLRVFFFQQKWPEFCMIVIHFYAQVFVSHLNEKHEYFRAGRAEHFETVYHKPSQCPNSYFLCVFHQVYKVRFSPLSGQMHGMRKGISFGRVPKCLKEIHRKRQKQPLPRQMHVCETSIDSCLEMYENHIGMGYKRSSQL